jgi:hypothetical protein
MSVVMVQAARDKVLEAAENMVGAVGQEQCEINLLTVSNFFYVKPRAECPGFFVANCLFLFAGLVYK